MTDDILQDLKNFNFTFNPDDYEKVSRWGVESHTEETKQLISQRKKGKKQTPEHIEKVRQTRIGSKQPQSQKIKASEKLSYDWILTKPSGEVIQISNLRKYCIDNGLDQGNMVKVADGITKQCKGWLCSRVTPKYNRSQE